MYNTFCELEWKSHPIGEAEVCGGDAMMRASAVAAVGGYRSDLVSGEEPELCLRLRAAGWRVWFLAALHGFHTFPDAFDIHKIPAKIGMEEIFVKKVPGEQAVPTKYISKPQSV
jgi:hypothetical protein